MFKLKRSNARKDRDEMARSVDTDKSDLGLTVCSDLSVSLHVLRTVLDPCLKSIYKDLAFS